MWSTASTGGKLWYSYRDRASETDFIDSYDPATGETTGGAVAVSQDTGGIPGGEEKNDGFGSFFQVCAPRLASRGATIDLHTLTCAFTLPRDDSSFT